MKQCKLSVENLDICPQNPLISDFHPAPETVKIKAKSFAKNHILKFSGNQWILKAVPHHNTNCGFVTTTVNTHTVNLFGWATIPGTKKPADYILVATKIDNQIIPISLLLLELKRDDVNKALNANKNIVFGFDKTLKISHADNQIYSYAVDNNQKQIYKLNEF